MGNIENMVLEKNSKCDSPKIKSLKENITDQGKENEKEN